jgi:hypothetical protein
MPLE